MLQILGNAWQCRRNGECAWVTLCKWSVYGIQSRTFLPSQLIDIKPHGSGLARLADVQTHPLHSLLAPNNAVHSLFPLNTAAATHISQTELDGLLHCARRLDFAAAGPERWRPLQGRHLALLCESDETPEARLFRDAAVGLGARVAAIHPSLSDLSAPEDISSMGRVLGRLYDGVECQGAAAALAHQIRSSAGVPVFECLSLHDQVVASLARLLDDAGAAEQSEHLVLQAVLLHAMGL